MVRYYVILATLFGTCACDAERYRRPISVAPHGEAFRANMTAQIIDPRPPKPHGLITDSERPILAVESYRTDQVKDPTAQATAPDTTSID